MQAHNIIKEIDQFSISKQRFESLVNRLISEETSRIDHTARVLCGVPDDAVQVFPLRGGCSLNTFYDQLFHVRLNSI